MTQPTGSSGKSTVLVVDDTPDNLSLISGLLEDNYKVKVATNGSKALRIASSENPPDLILLDIMMPEMDGYEVCRRLKADSKTSDIPVIFLTALSGDKEKETMRAIGAVDCIPKPINTLILMERVMTHLQTAINADDPADNQLSPG